MKTKRLLTIILSIIFACLSISVAFAEERGNEHGVLPPASIQNEYETNKEKYTDPRRAQGWVQVGNRWRYQLTDGSYVMNQWYQVANRWYHFDSAGYMQTGWFRDTDGKRYYLHDTEEYMMVKWVYTGGKWYYMDEHGVMQTGMLYKLMNYKPFIAQLHWVNTTAYHDITAKGYNDDFQTLFFYNPGTVPTQVEEELEYADFLNGCSFLDNSTGRYHSTLYIK